MEIIKGILYCMIGITGLVVLLIAMYLFWFETLPQFLRMIKKRR
jgi:hypothetical protein